MKKNIILACFTATLFFALVSCKPTEEPQPNSNFTDGVTVTTHDIEYITDNYAFCGAEVTADDMGLMIELGMCWSKTEKPTIEDHVLKTYTCSKPFNGILCNLEPNTKYYVRGYAKYGTEYCYGEEKTFTTLNNPSDSWGTFLTTLEATDICSYGFNTGGYISLPSGHNLFILFGGICYSESPEPTYYDCEGYTSHDPEYITFQKPYYSYASGLKPNTQYYYRAYLAFGEYNYGTGNYDLCGFIYGNILSITTPDVSLELEITTNHPVYYWWEQFLLASGYMYCNKPEAINEVGFCYSMENAFPQYESDLIATVATPTGQYYNFERNIYDLSANTKYYIRTYARYMTDSIRYGNIEEFFTY